MSRIWPARSQGIVVAVAVKVAAVVGEGAVVGVTGIAVGGAGVVACGWAIEVSWAERGCAAGGAPRSGVVAGPGEWRGATAFGMLQPNRGGVKKDPIPRHAHGLARPGVLWSGWVGPLCGEASFRRRAPQEAPRACPGDSHADQAAGEGRFVGGLEEDELIGARAPLPSASVLLLDQHFHLPAEIGRVDLRGNPGLKP